YDAHLGTRRILDVRRWERRHGHGLLRQRQHRHPGEWTSVDDGRAQPRARVRRPHQLRQCPQRRCPQCLSPHRRGVGQDIDGDQKAGRPWTGTPAAPTTTQPVQIARYPGGYGGAEYLPGVVDDARIYNRALSATEVWALFTTH